MNDLPDICYFSVIFSMIGIFNNLKDVTKPRFQTMSCILEHLTNIY